MQCMSMPLTGCSVIRTSSCARTPAAPPICAQLSMLDGSSATSIERVFKKEILFNKVPSLLAMKFWVA